MNIDNQSTNSKDRETTEYRVLPILVSFLIAGFIGLFSETALNMALNSLIGDFGIQETTVQWLTTGYLLTLGILVPSFWTYFTVVFYKTIIYRFTRIFNYRYFYSSHLSYLCILNDCSCRSGNRYCFDAAAYV